MNGNGGPRRATPHITAQYQRNVRGRQAAGRPENPEPHRLGSGFLESGDLVEAFHAAGGGGNEAEENAFGAGDPGSVRLRVEDFTG